MRKNSAVVKLTDNVSYSRFKFPLDAPFYTEFSTFISKRDLFVVEYLKNAGWLIKPETTYTEVWLRDGIIKKHNDVIWVIGNNGFLAAAANRILHGLFYVHTVFNAAYECSPLKVLDHLAGLFVYNLGVYKNRGALLWFFNPESLTDRLGLSMLDIFHGLRYKNLTCDLPDYTRVMMEQIAWNSHLDITTRIDREIPAILACSEEAYCREILARFFNSADVSNLRSIRAHFNYFNIAHRHARYFHWRYWTLVRFEEFSVRCGFLEKITSKSARTARRRGKTKTVYVAIK